MVRPTPVSGRLTATAKEHSVTIDVRDSGGGFPVDIVGRVFEPYVSRSDSPGAGIGLAIVRGIIDAHGGTVELALDGGGFTFVRICLPIEPRETVVGE